MFNILDTMLNTLEALAAFLVFDFGDNELGDIEDEEEFVEIELGGEVGGLEREFELERDEGFGDRGCS